MTTKDFATKNQGSFAFTSIAPAGIGGQVSAGWYSLGTQSTVPFVSLRGLGGKEKVFSWGELICVPEGASATVYNASAHKGDIYLQGGRDYANTPARVTVPVFMPQTIVVPGFPPVGFSSFAPEWPVDTRRARRAWLVVQLVVPSAATVSAGATIIGRVVNHSLNTAINGFTGIQGYNDGQSWAPGTKIDYIPLGYSAQDDETRAMALLDTATATIDVFPSGNAMNTTAFYVLEY